jgi:hypothetical protein
MVWGSLMSWYSWRFRWSAAICWIQHHWSRRCKGISTPSELARHTWKSLRTSLSDLQNYGIRNAKKYEKNLAKNSPKARCITYPFGFPFFQGLLGHGLQPLLHIGSVIDLQKLLNTCFLNEVFNERTRKDVKSLTDTGAQIGPGRVVGFVSDTR